ncbi:hypothetical protein FrEUN1fDRAFT_2654 [Parafrankia sp. EUN1f]|nr:hypothetical protein FrEUN1fDRAFT_2654 [Parafrankia sp. EUN1f]
MKHVSLGGLDVSRIGLGAMTMAGTYTSGGGLDDAESIRAIHPGRISMMSRGRRTTRNGRRPGAYIKSRARQEKSDE